MANRLFFQAYDGKVGNELFVFSDNAPTTTGIPNQLVGLDSSSSPLICLSGSKTM